MMEDNYKEPWKISLQQRTIHELAKICWDKFVLRDNIVEDNISISHKTKLLITYRKEVINLLPQILNYFSDLYSTNIPLKLMKWIFNALINLQYGYYEALIWEKRCQSALPFTIINPKTAGKYQAGYFIDPTGHFNDFAWVKRFVYDENQQLLHRFQFACFYCFESAITNMWHAVKSKLHSADKLKFIKSTCGDLVGFWAYKCENKFYELITGDRRYVGSFHICSLYEAIFGGHEYAARFFWSRCSDNEKLSFKLNFDIDLMTNAAENQHAGVVHFMFLILDRVQQCNLLRTVEMYEKTTSIWSCLLHSKFYETALNVIMSFQSNSFKERISTEIYDHLLTSLAFKIKELEYPVHKIIFTRLWNNLSQKERKEVLEINFSIIKNFFDITAVDLLEIVIQPLLHFEKDKMLLQDWQGAGKSAIDEFSKVGDYDAMLRYLHLFFIDRDSVSQKLRLRVDAYSLLERFTEELLSHWIKQQTPQLVKKNIDSVIDIIEGSLSVLYQILKQLKDML